MSITQVIYNPGGTYIHTVAAQRTPEQSSSQLHAQGKSSIIIVT